MEIQPSRQHQPDRFGPLSPRIAPGPDGLDRLPVRQQFLPPAAAPLVAAPFPTPATAVSPSQVKGVLPTHKPIRGGAAALLRY